MQRWSGLLKVPICPNSSTCYKVAVSLCFCPESKPLIVPSANAIFFNGDHAEGTGNPIIEKLSEPQKIAAILASKFPCTVVNTWVIEASTFNGPFAVYKDFIPSVNRFGEPTGYNPAGFPASTSTISLLTSCLKEVKSAISRREEAFPAVVPSTSSHHPETILLGFSKGGTVLNQLLTELSYCELDKSSWPVEETQILPNTTESLLNSISNIHYVDVGLNAPGAYITDQCVIKRIADRVAEGAPEVSFFFHGTPRQWSDSRRGWIREEKIVMVNLLESESLRVGGKLKVCERVYFADEFPDLQMHFQIIEALHVFVADIS